MPILQIRKQIFWRLKCCWQSQSRYRVWIYICRTLKPILFLVYPFTAILFNVIYSFSFILKAMLKRPFPFLCKLIGWAFLHVILTLRCSSPHTHTGRWRKERNAGSQTQIIKRIRASWCILYLEQFMCQLIFTSSAPRLIRKIKCVQMQYFWSENLISESKIKAEKKADNLIFLKIILL